MNEHLKISDSNKKEVQFYLRESNQQSLPPADDMNDTTYYFLREQNDKGGALRKEGELDEAIRNYDRGESLKAGRTDGWEIGKMGPQHAASKLYEVWSPYLSPLFTFELSAFPLPASQPHSLPAI